MTRSLIYITPYLPSRPSGSGYYSRAILTKLSADFEITCFSYFRREDGNLVEKFKKYADALNIEMHLIEHNPPQSKPSMFEPLSLHAMKNDALSRMLSQKCGEKLYDVAHVEHLDMAFIAQYLNAKLKSITIHELPDVREISEAPYSRGAELRSHLGQFLRWKLAEPFYLSQYNKVFVFTGEEAAALKAMRVFKTNPALLPVGPETAPAGSAEKECDMLFFANFEHQPNIDSLRYIAEKLLPVFGKKKNPPSVMLAGSAMPDWAAAIENKYSSNYQGADLVLASLADIDGEVLGSLG